MLPTSCNRPNAGLLETRDRVSNIGRRDHECLVSYGTAKMDRGEIPDVRKGYINRRLSFGLIINEAGELVGIHDFRTPVEVADWEKPDKKKTIYKPVMRRIDRVDNHTNSITPHFGSDNSSYLLGLDIKKSDKASKKAPKKSSGKDDGSPKYKSCKDLHLKVLRGYMEKHPEIAEEKLTFAKAVCLFFENWDWTTAAQHPAIQALTSEQVKEFGQNSYITFILAGASKDEANPTIISDDEVCHAAFYDHFIDEVYNEPGTMYGKCNITGEENIPLATVSYGGVNTGGTPLYLMSQGSDSEHSTVNNRGLRRCENYRIGKLNAMILNETLNYLINDPHHCYRFPNGAWQVFWSDSEADNMLSKAIQTAVFDDRITHNDTEQDKNVAQAVKAMLSGKDVDAYEEIAKHNPEMFYLLTLKENSARLVVKNFECGSFGAIMENVKALARDTAVVRRGNEMAGDLRTFTFRELARALEIHKKGKKKAGPNNKSNALYTTLMNAIIENGRFPTFVGSLIINNIGFDRWFTQEREALMRGYVLRNGLNAECKEAVADPNLNMDTNCPAYLLGELLSACLILQNEASGNPKVTVVDRFFSRMLYHPTVVLPELLQLSTAHISKLTRSEDKKATGRYWERKIDDLMARLKFPLTDAVVARPEQKMTFCLGFMAAQTYQYLPKEAKAKVAQNGAPIDQPLNLDEECENPSYVAGRIFQRCESIQKTALPNVVNGVKECYFGMAINQCEAILPMVLAKAPGHLNKIKKDAGRGGIAVWNERQLEELVFMLPHDDNGDLALLSMMNGTYENKCSFLLGYYHARVAQWRKKNADAPTDAEGEEADPTDADTSVA